MVSSVTPAPAPSDVPTQPAVRPLVTPLQVLLALLGVGLSLGQLDGGFYGVRSWGVLAIVAGVVLIALLVTREWRPPTVGLVALGALVGLAVLSALSVLWAESASATSPEAHRWALYAMTLGVGLLGVGGPRERVALLAGVGVGAAGVALVLTVTIAGGGGQDLFIIWRLTNPLGYVNGQALAFIVLFWPALAAAERGRGPATRGVPAAFAVLAVGLLVLTQSRGAVLALVLSLLVVLAVVPGRLRRAGTLLSVLLGLVVAFPALNDVYTSRGRLLGQPSVDALQAAGLRLLLGALLAGVVWGVGSRLLEVRAGDHRLVLRRVASVVVAVGVVAALVVGLVRIGDPVAEVRTQYDNFTSVDRALPRTDRLLAATSNRYDYWRVAWEELKSAPVGGVGAGNYSSDYFRLRRTDEDVRQPHSLEMQALSELGVLGFALVATLVGALLWACWAAGRRVRRGATGIGGIAAAIGVVVAWVVQSAVDWVHLLPSLTMTALLVATALMPGRRAVSVGSRTRVPLVVGAILLVVVAAAGAGRLVLADRALQRAQDVARKDPSAAITQANRSLDLLGEQLPALYVRAAALEQRGDAQGARATLGQAARLEPGNFIPYALLGDLAVSEGDDRRAITAYGEALERNPRNEVVREDIARAFRAVAREQG